MWWGRKLCLDGGGTAVKCLGGLVGRCTAKWDLVSSSASIRDFFFKVLYVPLRMLCLLYVTSDPGC